MQYTTTELAAYGFLLFACLVAGWKLLSLAGVL